MLRRYLYKREGARLDIVVTVSLLDIFYSESASASMNI
jgi:hypothetical protein